MDAGLRRTLNTALCDNRLQKADVRKLAESALDGKGVTRNELKDLKKIRDRHGDQMTHHAAKSLDGFIAGASRSWSRTKEVHLPNVDDARLDSLLNDPRVATSNGGRVSGGESSAGPRDFSPSPRVSGGE